MKRCLILTGHFAHQKRRGAMLWVADHLWEMGWHVTLASVGYSWLSDLRGDARLRSLPEPPMAGLNNVKRGFDTLFYKTLLHPFATGWPMLDPLVGRLQARGFARPWAKVLREAARSSDLVLVESGAPMILAPHLRKIAPQAQMIYRVNDDLRFLSAPRWMVQAERENMTSFDRISTGSAVLAERFDGHPNVTLDPMGIPRERMADPGGSPFASREKIQAVCAGTTQFEAGQVLLLAEARPAWDIHVFGRVKGALPVTGNLHWHGETEFAEVLRHVAHADVGLAPFPDAPGIAYQADHSNRLLMYRHFGLPVLGPMALAAVAEDILDIADPHAWDQAATRPRQPRAIPDWSVLALRLAQNGVIEPVPEVISPPDIAV